MNPKDCYQVAIERRITPAEAYQQMKAEGWAFVEYNDCGEETYQSPQSELEERCQTALAAIEEVAAVKSIAPKEVQARLLGIIDVIQDHVDTLERHIEE